MKKELKKLDTVVFPNTAEGQVLFVEFAKNLKVAFPEFIVKSVRERKNFDPDASDEEDGKEFNYFDVKIDPDMFEEFMAWIIIDGWGRCSHALVSLGQMRYEGNKAARMMSAIIHEMVKTQRPDINPENGIDSIPDRLEPLIPKSGISNFKTPPMGHNIKRLGGGVIDLFLFPKCEHGYKARTDFEESLKQTFTGIIAFEEVSSRPDTISSGVKMPGDLVDEYLAWLIGNGWMMGSHLLEAIMQLGGKGVPDAQQQMDSVMVIVNEKYPNCWDPADSSTYNNKYKEFMGCKSTVIAKTDAPKGMSDKKVKKTVEKDILGDLSSDEN